MSEDQRLEDYKTFVAALLTERDRRFDAENETLRASIAALEKLMEAGFSSAKEAVNKALLAQEGVNLRQNEFRGSLSDLTGTMMPRKETESLITGLRERIDSLQKATNMTAGASTHGQWVWERIAAWAMALIALATLWWRGQQ